MGVYTGWVILLYGLFVGLGGYIGYTKANSLPSLIMGLTFGVLLFISGIVMLKSSPLAFYIATVLTVLLTLFFSYRFFHSLAFMPSGLMALLSLIALAFLLYDWIHR